MKASELRIGNVIKHKDHILTVIEVLKHGVHFTTPNQASYAWLAYEDLQPIPLSEDLLLKCGFVQGITPDMYFCTIKDWYHIIIDGDKFIFRGLGASIVQLTSLHHLQNLYHALTGEELNVKL